MRVVAAFIALSVTFPMSWGAEAQAQEMGDRIRVAVGRSEVLTLRDSIGTVSIADDKVADVVVATPRQVLIIGKKVGVTTLVVWGRGSRYEQYDLVVHRGELASNQVTLNITVAEVDRSKLRETGIDFGILRFNDDFLQGSGFLGSYSGQVSPPAFPLIFSSDVALALDYISLGNDTRIQAIIHALEQNGSAKVLANPSLVAVNGQTASFLSGGEFPIPVVQSVAVGGAATSVTVLFKEFGVKVEFEPTIIDSNIVNLKVKPELSRPDFERAVEFSGFLIPSFITRRVETVVEMREGESLVIGGLKQQQKQKIVSKTPLLGDIPVLGNLFKRVRDETIDQELLVLVTPRFARPMQASQVPDFPDLYESEKN
jgi:pilus assembly protein CpaC